MRDESLREGLCKGLSKAQKRKSQQARNGLGQAVHDHRGGTQMQFTEPRGPWDPYVQAFGGVLCSMVLGCG